MACLYIIGHHKVQVLVPGTGVWAVGHWRGQRHRIFTENQKTEPDFSIKKIFMTFFMTYHILYIIIKYESS